MYIYGITQLDDEQLVAMIFVISWMHAGVEDVSKESLETLFRSSKEAVKKDRERCLREVESFIEVSQHFGYLAMGL